MSDNKFSVLTMYSAHLYTSGKPTLRAQTIHPTSQIAVPTSAPQEIIDVDQEDPSKAKPAINQNQARSSSESSKLYKCNGYKPYLPVGISPYTSYPFGLHDTFAIPWEPNLCGGVLVLFAKGCTKFSTSTKSLSCSECQQLKENKMLEGIIWRMANGVHKNATFAYHGISGLTDVLRRKDKQIVFYKLRGLNQAKKLLSAATSLTEQKRLLNAIASGRVSRVDHLLSIGLQQKKGVRSLLMSLELAARGFYKPKNYTEEEAMRGLLVLRMGGNRLAHILHNSQDAPSVSYLRSRSTVPIIIPSPAKPTIQEIEANVSATVETILQEMRELDGEVVHAVLMFDELATEKRIWWDPKTNRFLGLCREHAHLTSTEFINEGDMEEMYQAIDDGEVHYAGEVCHG